MWNLFQIYLYGKKEKTDEEIDKVTGSTADMPRKIMFQEICLLCKEEDKRSNLQEHFKNKLKIDYKDVIVLKEIPVRILRKSKDYSFVTGQPFCFDTMKRIILMYNKKRYKLNSALKWEFYKKFKDEFGEGQLKEKNVSQQ